MDHLEQRSGGQERAPELHLCASGRSEPALSQGQSTALGTHCRRQQGVDRRFADLNLIAAGNPGSLQSALGWHPGHPPSCPLPTLAFDCGELRVAEQINFLHTSLCARPRPPGPPARPRPRRQLDWAINLRGPRPPPAPVGPGLCAASAGRGPGRPPGLLALIRRPRHRLCHAGSPAAPSRTPSAHPRPLGSVHLSEPRDAPRRRAGGGVPWAGREPAPLHPAPHVSEAPPTSQRHGSTRARTHAGASQLRSVVMMRGRECCLRSWGGENPSRGQEPSVAPPLHPRCGAWLVAPITGAGKGGREK